MIPSCRSARLARTEMMTINTTNATAAVATTAISFPRRVSRIFIAPLARAGAALQVALQALRASRVASVSLGAPPLGISSHRQGLGPVEVGLGRHVADRAGVFE